MSPAVVATATIPPPFPLPPAAREVLITHVSRLLDYLLNTTDPLAGIAAGHLVECATIISRVAAVLLALVPLD